MIDRLLSGVMVILFFFLLYFLLYFVVRKLYRDVRFIKLKYYDGWVCVVKEIIWLCDFLVCLLFFMVGFLVFYEIKYKKNLLK